MSSSPVEIHVTFNISQWQMSVLAWMDNMRQTLWTTMKTSEESLVSWKYYLLALSSALCQASEKVWPHWTKSQVIKLFSRLDVLATKTPFLGSGCHKPCNPLELLAHIQGLQRWWVNRPSNYSNGPVSHNAASARLTALLTATQGTEWEWKRYCHSFDVQSLLDANVNLPNSVAWWPWIKHITSLWSNVHLNETYFSALAAPLAPQYLLYSFVSDIISVCYTFTVHMPTQTQALTAFNPLCWN